MGLRSRFGEIKQRFRPSSVEERIEAVVFESCAGRSLTVGMFGHKAIVTFTLKENIFWHQRTPTGDNDAPEQHQQTNGAAAVKLSLGIDEQYNKNLTHVRCRTKFSQETYQGVHVHECWPCIRGRQNSKTIQKGATFSPDIGVAGVSVALGGVYRDTEEHRLSAWTFVAKSSPSIDKPGAWVDVVTFSWTAPGTSDHTDWSGRNMYGAAVLVCAEHALIIEPSVHKGLVGLHPEVKADVHLEKRNSLRGEFAMVKKEPRGLQTLCTDTETWTTERNRQAVPEGM
jgi:hypothetical protein